MNQLTKQSPTFYERAVFNIKNFFGKKDPQFMIRLLDSDERIETKSEYLNKYAKKATESDIFELFRGGTIFQDIMQREIVVLLTKYSSRSEIMFKQLLEQKIIDSDDAISEILKSVKNMIQSIDFYVKYAKRSDAKEIILKNTKLELQVIFSQYENGTYTSQNYISKILKRIHLSGFECEEIKKLANQYQEKFSKLGFGGGITLFETGMPSSDKEMGDLTILEQLSSGVKRAEA